MPSIEILCVGLSGTRPMPETSFAVLCDPGCQSHRAPTPRFQVDFDRLGGVLYHIGNADLAGEPDGAFFAYDILSEASRGAEPRSFLELAPAHLASAQRFLDWLLASSPSGQIVFTSDWQFGPDWIQRFDALDLPEFWRRHASRELLLNAAYVINAGGETR